MSEGSLLSLVDIVGFGAHPNLLGAGILEIILRFTNASIRPLARAQRMPIVAQLRKPRADSPWRRAGEKKSASIGRHPVDSQWPSTRIIRDGIESLVPHLNPVPWLTRTLIILSRWIDYCVPRSRGSNASRRPSPRKLKANIVMASASAGKMAWFG